MTEKRELGKITETHLGREDHGIMTFYVYFDFGGTSQGFGGYVLDTYNKKTEKREGTAFGCEVINRILEAVGVRRWEDLVGNEMWVIRNREGFDSKIIGIEAPKYRKNAGRPFVIDEVIQEFKLDEETP